MKRKYQSKADDLFTNGPCWGCRENMTFLLKQAGKNSSPIQVTSRDTEYGEQLAHFPSAYRLPFCGSQRHPEQSVLLKASIQLWNLPIELRWCPERWRSGRWAGSRGARPPSGCSVGTVLNWSQPNEPPDHSQYLLLEKLRKSFKKTPALIYNKLQKETLLWTVSG